jgi:trk system potassium uptake protein TrkH
MNIRFVLNQLALLSLVLSVVLLGIAAWSALEWWLGAWPQREPTMALAASAAISLGLGGGLWALTRGEATLRRREATLLVALTWLVAPLLLALPFFFWAVFGGAPAGHPFHSFVDCYFEAASGLSTCGATILGDIEALPRALLLWRAMTHWMGGLGIVVLFVAVLPSIGTGTKRLFSTEAALHAEHGQTQPRIRDTARILGLIYFGLTLAEVVALVIAGVDVFSAVCDSFGTIATGGYSVKNTSIAGYASAAVEWIIVFFMVCGGTNFAVHYRLVRGRWREVWRDPELRLYLGVLGVGSALATVALIGQPILRLGGEEHGSATLGQALRYGVFNVVSLGTDTGFATADFDRWPFFAQMPIVAAMFIGGCAGSTAGGIKVIRLLIAGKVLRAESESTYRPQVVRPFRVGGRHLEPDARTAALGYILLFTVTLLATAFLLMAIEPPGSISFRTAATASLACLADAGPGLGAVGPASNYAFFSDPAKLLLCLQMMLGRLEIFTLLVIVTPHFWKYE